MGCVAARSPGDHLSATFPREVQSSGDDILCPDSDPTLTGSPGNGENLSMLLLFLELNFL